VSLEIQANVFAPVPRTDKFRSLLADCGSPKVGLAFNWRIIAKALADACSHTTRQGLMMLRSSKLT
jgi:hypothetical protein